MMTKNEPIDILRNLGQLIVTGISGVNLTDEESEFILKENVGGVILFAHNFSDPAQLAELINEIQKLRDEYPLYIMTDHESGRVQRFKNQFTHFPPMFEIAKLGSPKTIYEVHQVMAKELTACGVNVNLAPCCDIWSNPQNKVIGDRSFGTDEKVVEKMVSAAIRGLHAEGILSCAKHFPGHGSTKKDSHVELPYLKTSLEDLRNFELVPFNRAVKSKVEFVMTSHIVVDSIDPALPISLSEKGHKLLREDLRFTGVIITDDLEMGAITEKHSVEDASLLALNAGANLLLYRKMETARSSLSKLKQVYKEKKIDRKLLETSIAKNVNLKAEKFPAYQPVYIPQLSQTMQSGPNKSFQSELLKKLDHIQPKA
ncbi:MAG: beta-N-acetylhexosaminidase [Bacteriovoracaceae bacterium]|nr:beta-N-acetylhexosaminidase [Bacteriovoracaceae bacterium]